MARKKLASLLDTPADAQTVDEQNTTDTAAAGAPATETTAAAETPAPETPAPAATPRFEDFLRKEARFRDDQIENPGRHARRLQRLRTAPGERITDNTLIRVAVDLLMTRVDELQGSNEAELRSSLGITD